MSLFGKNIIFLGSSVTEGYASGGISFVELLRDKYQLEIIKEAVSGTTLIDRDTDGKGSYIKRMRKIPAEFAADAFVCQLSTNDATTGAVLGEVSDSFDRDSFDLHEVTGAMEYIISYAKDTWNCPVIFYTGTRYDSPAYERMIDRLYELKEKWKIHVIDLFYDESMNAVSKEDYERYMSDPIHPLLTGYEQWWLPKIEGEIVGILQEF